jgi:tetratricopeptide (TPR) repeat protein
MSALRLVLAAALVLSPAAGAGDAAAQGARPGQDGGGATAEPESGLTHDDLERMLAPLGDPQVEARRAAAGAVAALGQEAVGAITAKLAELRRASDDGAASLLRGLRDRVAKEQGFDLLETLAVQRTDPAGRRALATDAMLRALAHAGSTPAVRQLVTAAGDLAGGLRPEIGRLVRQLGDRAVPALVESRREPLPEVRSWGAALLDSLGKRTPGDAVRTRDNHLLGEILRAYGLVGDLDALPVILSFANSERVEVRAAAREATLAYGQDGVWRLREAYAVLLGEQAPEGTPAADLARRLFEAYDRYRLRDVRALVDRGLAAAAEGNAGQAVAAFDEALAQEPMIDRRAEMVPAYVDRAGALEATDPAAALAYLRKALRLDETGPRSAHVRSAIRYLEGRAAVARGVEDTEPFEQAVLLDPDNRAARAELDRLRRAPERSHAGRWRAAAAGAVVALAAAGILLLGGRRR